MNGWFRPTTGKPMAQADGDDSSTMLPEPKTTREPYPHLDSIAKDEAIFRLKKQYELLEKRVADLEKRP